MDRSTLPAPECDLIDRIEATGSQFDQDHRGWGFFYAGDAALALVKDLPGVKFLDLLRCARRDWSRTRALPTLRGSPA